MPLAKKMILLAEDDPDTLLVLKDRLESFGYQVAAVSNGEEAVKKMKQDDGYAAVVMDVEMPRMGGIEALRMIKRIQPEIPVIMIAAVKEKAMDSLSEGARTYLLKPVDPAQLKKTLERCFAPDETEGGGGK